ncbi:hypothetical protein B9Z19DRAFT_1065952 [Tuber borchii]|uniref:Uncharacterized protein n=1 Tax=Tuber borchii TaxID=42251 RepID=A0A2T6ZP75_TUBBO|nr:hypothetical protein B9Z19DRAFT_1065952 [Tuber borchii]
MSELSSAWQDFLLYYAVPLTTIGAAIILVMEHRIRPRPIKVIMEPNDHDLRCGCRTELVQIRSQLDDLEIHMARHDADFEGMPYQGAPDRTHIPGAVVKEL